MATASADLFAQLLSSDALWRGRVFKVLQYAARFALLFHDARSLLMTVLPPEKRLNELAKSLSLARRAGALFDSAVYIRDAAAQLRALSNYKRGTSALVIELLSSPRTLSAVLNAFAGTADDLSTSGFIGLLDVKLLPPWFEKLHSALWASQCLFSLYFASVTLATVRTSLASARRQVLTDLNSGAVHTLAAPISAGQEVIAALERQHKFAALNFIKSLCDVGQSLPHGLQKSSLLPPWLDISMGLASSVLAVYRVWSDAEERVKAEASASAPASSPSATIAAAVAVGSGSAAPTSQSTPHATPSSSAAASASGVLKTPAHGSATAVAVRSGAAIPHVVAAREPTRQPAVAALTPMLAGLDVAPSPIARRDEAVDAAEVASAVTVASSSGEEAAAASPAIAEEKSGRVQASSASPSDGTAPATNRRPASSNGKGARHKEHLAAAQRVLATQAQVARGGGAHAGGVGLRLAESPSQGDHDAAAHQ